MAKQFLDDDDILTFVMRDLKQVHEPLFSILKIMEITEEGTVILLNLMTGMGEKTTKDEILEKYQVLKGENLQKHFTYVYQSHGVEQGRDIEFDN